MFEPHARETIGVDHTGFMWTETRKNKMAVRLDTGGVSVNTFEFGTKEEFIEFVRCIISTEAYRVLCERPNSIGMATEVPHSLNRNTTSLLERVRNA